MVYETSQLFTPWVIDDIHAKAELGRYRIRGFSTFQKVTHFDDLTFLSTGLTRFPLEGYKERCNTRTVIGARHAENPLVIDIPIYITGMSYGLSDTWVGQAYEFVGAVARGVPLGGGGFEDGYAVDLVREAAMLSAERGALVRIDEISTKVEGDVG